MMDLFLRLTIEDFKPINVVYSLNVLTYGTTWVPMIDVYPHLKNLRKIDPKY